MTRRDFSIRDIHMALDGELPGDERDDFQHWLDTNPDMKALNGRFEADRDMLGAAFAGVLDEPLPARILEQLSDGAAPRRRAAVWWQAIAAAILLLIGGSGGYIAGLAGLGTGDGQGNQLAEGAIAAHEIYSNERRHAVEVAATEKDHLGSWLSNRIGLTLVIPDLSEEGFELLGGRLLPNGEGAAALLLYEDKNGQRVSVYVTDQSTTKSKGKYEAEDGATAVYWLDRGYGCAIVGVLPKERIDAVARDAWRQLVTGLKV
ncbi:MAG TPA: anti-sigma factor [Rhizobiaceae bacterium]|nr:anti-sigma factor [Rhizobiaceae bacterium]